MFSAPIFIPIKGFVRGHKMFLVITDVPGVHQAEVWDVKTLRTNVPNYLFPRSQDFWVDRSSMPTHLGLRWCYSILKPVQGMTAAKQGRGKHLFVGGERE